MRLGLFIFAIVLHYIPNFLPDVFCLRQFQGMAVYFMLGVVCCDWKQQISFISKVPAWCVFGFFAVAEGINLMDMGGANINASALPWYRSGNGFFFSHRKIES